METQSHQVGIDHQRCDSGSKRSAMRERDTSQLVGHNENRSTFLSMHVCVCGVCVCVVCEVCVVCVVCVWCVVCEVCVVCVRVCVMCCVCMCVCMIM